MVQQGSNDKINRALTKFAIMVDLFGPQIAQQVGSLDISTLVLCGSVIPRMPMYQKNQPTLKHARGTYIEGQAARHTLGMNAFHISCAFFLCSCILLPV